MPENNTEPSKAPRPKWITWVLPMLLVLSFVLWPFLSKQGGSTATIPYGTFYSLVESGKVAKVTLTGQHVRGAFKADEVVDGQSIREFQTNLPQQEDRELLPLLRAQKIELKVEAEGGSWWSQLLVSAAPWVLILGGWFWLSRRMQAAGAGGPGGPLAGMMKSRSHRVERQDAVDVHFDDVAGLASAKRDLQEIVEFLKEPQRFGRLGGKVPRGVLLVGPPGTGKTLLARAVAGEARVPFFYINGSEFIQLFVGVGASRVRELFAEAKKTAPAIIFIDELDAVGRSRGTGVGGGNDEREQTLNQLLAEMDGFSRNDLTVVLAATNRPDVLDAALLRPGRFDRRVVIDRPERPAREAILKVHTKEKPLAPDVSLQDIAASTPGFSGADLANLANEAALTATRNGADAITSKDFSLALDKLMLGDPREMLLDSGERRRIAVHESGHAVIAHFTEHADKPKRVSILPRGMSLGATQQASGPDRHLATQPELEAKLTVLMGGYASESLSFGSVSSGSENDLRSATDIAINMVAHYGMSESIGPMFHEQRLEHPFLGQRLATEGGSSDETVHAVEQEARRILIEALRSAKETITKHRDVLDRLVNALLELETIDGRALERVLQGERPIQADTGTATGTSEARSVDS